MSKSFAFICLLQFVFIGLSGQQALDKYGGSQVPQLFESGLISINTVQWNNALDGIGHLYLTKQLSNRSELIVHYTSNSTYEKAQVIPIDTNAIHSDVWVNTAGDHIIFMSTLKSELNDGFNLWQSIKVNGHWQKPTEFHEATSGIGGEAYPWLAQSGNLYFSVARDNSRNSDIYVLEKEAMQATALPSNVNSDAFEGDAFVAPDESYLIFAAFDRPEALGLSDLFISFNDDGNWTQAKWMGESINSAGYDGSPVVSPDGRFLLFTSSRASVGQERIFFNHYIVEFNPDDYR